MYYLSAYFRDAPSHFHPGPKWWCVPEDSEGPFFWALLRAEGPSVCLSSSL